MKVNVFLFLILMSSLGFSQSTRQIVKDFDGDKKRDTVYIDSDEDKLYCMLSSNNYKKVASQEIRSLNFGNTLEETPNGFEFWNDYGRSGFINEFQYNKKAKKMQLVLMKRTDYDIDRYKYGEAVRHGSGKSSVNLITNQYIGNFYDVYQEKLRKLSTISETMVFPETFIDSFSDAINFDYEKRCLSLYEEAKKLEN